MDLKAEIDRATTGAELVALAEKAKIALPPGFAKMSIDRKKRALLTAAPPPAKDKPKATFSDRAAKALSGFGKGLRRAKVDPATLSPAEREKVLWDDRKEARKKLKAALAMPGNPALGIKGRTGAFVSKSRVIQILAADKIAPDPEVLPRQVRRQNQRRSDKLLLASLKAQAMKDRVQGGSAIIGMADVAVIRASAGYNAHA